ncbi:hypothetical protein FA95DRAFT_276312 [Auriscalpium vulgare]|uniref:Uncharacterized protein n=1 Tax=Auriscalpium vulgare TaxID=40419 RepID=A0ACB8S585_9AGAM|nr:hypothetical protein FA95DRAFT_276312 [Auriscalpium vulgare]
MYMPKRIKTAPPPPLQFSPAPSPPPQASVRTPPRLAGAFFPTHSRTRSSPGPSEKTDPDSISCSSASPTDPYLVVNPSLDHSVLLTHGLVEPTTLPLPTHNLRDVQASPPSYDRSYPLFMRQGCGLGFNLGTPEHSPLPSPTISSRRTSYTMTTPDRRTSSVDERLGERLRLAPLGQRASPAEDTDVSSVAAPPPTYSRQQSKGRKGTDTL